MFKGKLVFAAGNFGDYDIFLYDLCTDTLNQLTTGEAWNDYPRFSPDGSKIAFGSTRSGKQEIWTMNTDGSDAKSVTADLKWADFPTWSPDGQEIAFVSDAYFQMDIFALHLETGKLRRLTKDESLDSYPDWSPDGKHIAFASERGINQDIYVLDVDTLEQKRITTTPGPDTSPAFSPDGAKIAFVSHRPDEHMHLMSSFCDFFYGSDHLDIWTVELATGHMRQMTTNRGVDRNVRWSPDGKYLAYTSSSIDKADAHVKICEVATDKITPLHFDDSAVKQELERPFLADVNKPVTQTMSQGRLGDLLIKTGDPMARTVGHWTPQMAKNILEKYKQLEVDRWNPITARYIDWK
jgi:Tol biopolymer transport system component